VLTGEDGQSIATYGYTAYGKDDEDRFTGVDAPDAGDPTDGGPYNVYRFNAKRFDHGSGTYDMGFRHYNPGLNRFLSRDMYAGGLADLNLTMSPWTMNRYAFAGGNPITMIELDGHRLVCGDACDDYYGTWLGELTHNADAPPPEPPVGAEPPSPPQPTDSVGDADVWDQGAFTDVLIWHELRGLDANETGVITRENAYFYDWLDLQVNSPNRALTSFDAAVYSRNYEVCLSVNASVFIGASLGVCGGWGDEGYAVGLDGRLSVGTTVGVDGSLSGTVSTDAFSTGVDGYGYTQAQGTLGGLFSIGAEGVYDGSWTPALVGSAGVRPSVLGPVALESGVGGRATWTFNGL
jgi:RHS repeat-associated protein